MTHDDYDKVMKDHDPWAVGIARFKARLSHYVRAVRRGRTVTLLDRDMPVARVVPLERPAPGLKVRGPVRALKDLPAPPVRPRKGLDSLTVLLEERQVER